MISPKNLVLLSMLIFLSAPLFSSSARAQTISPSSSTAPCGNIGNSCPLSVSPAVVQGVPGSDVTVNIVLNDTIGLIGWRIQVLFDFTILRANSICHLDSDNVWSCPSQPVPPPWTSNLCASGASYFDNATLIQSSTPTMCHVLTAFDGNVGGGASTCPGGGGSIAASRFNGCLEESQDLLGAVTNVTSSTGLTLFSIDFTILTAGSSNIDLISTDQLLFGVFSSGPYAGSIASEALCTVSGPNCHLDPMEHVLLCTPGSNACIPGGPKRFFAFPHNGAVLGIGSADFIKSSVNPAFHHLSISRNGNVQTLESLVANTGTVQVYVRVEYTIVSEAGDVSFIGTGVLLLPPPSKTAASGVLNVAFSVPVLPMRYHAIGILMISADGLHFASSGNTATTQYSVVP